MMTIFFFSPLAKRSTDVCRCIPCIKLCILSLIFFMLYTSLSRLSRLEINHDFQKNIELYSNFTCEESGATRENTAETFLD